MTPAPPIMIIMKALIEAGPPMPRLMPVMVTSSSLARDPLRS